MKDKCKLCLEHELENVGSHIFTDAIIRSALYEEGKTKRGDHEIVANISLEKIGIDYFGASVLPEKRTEVLGKDQTDKEIEDTSDHPFINREMVCRSCEKKFGPVETFFAEKIYNTILKSDNINHTIVDNPYFAFDEFSFKVTKLMVYINIWRASTINHNNWSLPNDTEENIRQYLNNTLISNDIKEIVEAGDSNQKWIDNYSFTLGTLDQNEGLASENAILIDHTTKPYIFLLNRIIILFSIENFASLSIPDFINWDIAEIKEVIASTENLFVKYFNNTQRTEIVEGYFMRQWHEIVKHGHKSFAAMFKEMFYSDPLPKHHQLMDEYIKMALNKGYKGSPELVMQCAAYTFHSILRPRS